MDPHSLPVGSKDRFEERALESAMREMRKLHVGPARRTLFGERVGKGAENGASSPSPRCCFTTQRGTRCKHPSAPGAAMCAQHGKECSRRLSAYRRACKPTPERSAELYANAKELVGLFYASQDKARLSLRRAQEHVAVHDAENVPPPGEGGGASSWQRDTLNSYEAVVAPLRQAFRGMKPPSRRARASELVRANYAEWFGCWFGRMMYRMGCESCRQDSGHVAAYYLFKSATFIAKAVRDESSAPPSLPSSEKKEKAEEKRRKGTPSPRREQPLPR